MTGASHEVEWSLADRIEETIRKMQLSRNPCG